MFDWFFANLLKVLDLFMLRWLRDDKKAVPKKSV